MHSKRKYPYRHVSITYWTNNPKPSVVVYDEDKEGNSPEGFREREYRKMSNQSMLRLTQLIQFSNTRPHIVMGNTNVAIFFWLKRKTGKGRKS